MARAIEIQFPTAGVSRRAAFHVEGRREPFSSPWALNVRLEDDLTNRLRGGSFTGQKSATFTVNASTDVCTSTAHPFLYGMPVQLTTTDTLPAGLSLLTTYYIISWTANTFQLSTEHGGSAVDITDTGTGVHTATPVFAKINPVYRDRAITFSSNAITAARQGDSTDTDLTADVSDVQRPILFQLSEADAVGGNVVAVAPHKDAYLLCFTAHETWVLSGDPATGGLRRVSDQVGIIGASAWCTNHDTIYFLSDLGLYKLQADGSGLEPVSEDRIPVELTGISDSAAILTYSHADRGVNIHLTTAPSWFYDTAREGFWPFDTTETDSHLLIGPLKLGSTDMQGLIQTLHGIMAQGSATVNWRIVPGDTAEEAAANGKLAIEAALASLPYSTYVRGSGSWTAGRSSTERPRTTAMWACIWLSSTGTWAYERLTLGVEPSGEWR